MHFTYAIPSGDSLRQGDVLQRTAALNEVLGEVFPYHHDHSDYRFFMVITQSCDLALRNDGCKSPYVGLCVVRPLQTVMARQLAKLQKSPFEREHGFCSERQRVYLHDFLRNLMRNDIDDYFYLEPEPEFGITEPLVAFLALSLAVKANLHYSTCREARILRLSEEFSIKLGWLIGNMYSRVGTKDWVPTVLTEEKFEERIDSELDQLCAWLPPSEIKALKRAAEKGEISFGADGRLDESTVKELTSRAEKSKRSQRQRLADLSTEIVFECLPKEYASEKAMERIRGRLASDPDLGQILKG